MSSKLAYTLLSVIDALSTYHCEDGVAGIPPIAVVDQTDKLPVRTWVSSFVLPNLVEPVPSIVVTSST